MARLLAKVGLGKEAKAAATNTVQVAKAGGTNKVETAENAPPPLTGNEPPEELMRRVREMRDAGRRAVAGDSRQAARVVPERRLAAARPGRPGRRAAGPVRGLGQHPPGAPFMFWPPTRRPAAATLCPCREPVRVRTGITDGSYTEITEGLKEGDRVITAVKLPAAQAASLRPPAQSPFGGPPRFR